MNAELQREREIERGLCISLRLSLCLSVSLSVSLCVCYVNVRCKSPQVQRWGEGGAQKRGAKLEALEKKDYALFNREAHHYSYYMYL